MNAENNNRVRKAGIFRRKAELAGRPLVLARDPAITVLLGLSVPILMVLPERSINPLVKTLARLLPASLGQHASPEAISRSLGATPAQAHAIFRHQLEARLQSIAWFLRYMVRGRQYDIDIEGREEIGRALAGGNGVIVWIADLVFGSECVRQALYQMGWPSAHMARPEHGFSPSEFGVRLLNPIRTKTEDKFLHERIMFDRASPAAAIHKMSARLKQNGVVSLLACADEGKSLIEAEFMAGKTVLASGGPRLAFTSGCPILPAFVVPSPEPPRFKAIIGSPLAMTSSKRDEALLEATKDFLSRLEPFVRTHPHLWRGWPALAESQPALPRDAESMDDVNLRAPASAGPAR
jgi:lauroyl/myristoyl acyltransferase